jgi:hypothetical protein
MAQRVQVILLCDMDEAETPAAETVTFGLDGTGYEIDLCASHAAGLRDALTGYVGAARRTGSRGGRSGGRRRSARSGRANEIREWARGQGIGVSERGRISADLQARYDAAHR